MEHVPIDLSPPPAPAPRSKEKRLTDELKAMPAGGSFVADDLTARAYAEYARGHGFKVVRKMLPDGRVRIWRTA